MVFAYYSRLTKRQQSIYRQSDRIENIRLNDPVKLISKINGLEHALKSEDRASTKLHSKQIIDVLVKELVAPPINTRVLKVRPSDNWGELHGYYEPIDAKQIATITVWMRTAKHKRVVAFRTFLRTLLHEFCHHLDYELFQLADSFHTEGFFKRESNLFKQLIGNEE